MFFYPPFRHRNLILRLASLAAFIVSLAPPVATAQSAAPPTRVPLEWQTHAERTDYRETPRYDETIAYVKRLAAASSQIRYTTFGVSGEGRALPLVVAASNGEFDARKARASGKAIVLIQACIHAGESDGKDAGLALLRDIAITKTRADLLRQAVILFIPIYNADGHERWSAYNRINQQGPAAMGWRANATRLNLNRDYAKADAPETRAWLKLWNEWTPDLFVDCHTTDGADFQPNVTYQYEARANVEPSIAQWMRVAFEQRIRPATERAGNILSPYLTFRDNRDPQQGVEAFISTPRFATAYIPVLRNRPALLIETHALKSNRVRVRGAYDLLRATLEEVNRDPASLRQAVRAADEATARRSVNDEANARLPLALELTDKPEPFELKGLKFRRELSEVSGAVRVIFGTEPQDYTVPFYNDVRITSEVTLPRAYIVPPEWAEVIERLALHGVRFTRTSAPLTIDAETYRFSEVKLGSASFEGRVLVGYKIEPVRLSRTYPRNSVLINLDQPNARIAVHLLEPAAPDSLAAWGFFNTIFEQKEYGEDYVVEKLAREMLARDENLRREFENRVRSDPRFAASARERLRFFFERSPYHDAELNLYPVGRLTTMLK